MEALRESRLCDWHTCQAPKEQSFILSETLSRANTPIMISSVCSLQLRGGVLIHSNERAFHGDGK